MRKYQQEKILELLKTLNEAHGELRKPSAHKTIVYLLADCQAFAARIGAYIEEIQGTGTKTAALLEQYRTAANLMAVDVDENNDRRVRGGNRNTADANHARALRKRLIEVENSVKDELKPNKIEMVFFPYKASMWDSLESIWLATKDDERCDAYVVPIPYFDKNPDGSFGKMHYEGNQYPDYVPVTDWRAYDVAARRPDVIFTHNPYDDQNHVTSVHPNFYNSWLKGFTDQLVFVPYAVTSTDKVAEYFALLPCMRFADKVIVQSETIRKSYIDHLRKFAKESSRVAEIGEPRKRFAALGSPKFDRMLASPPAISPIPAAWRAMIEVSGHLPKKVVLYNTSLGKLLEAGETYLDKLGRVLDLFKNRRDVVLLWRPHPLIEATLQSMRPHLLDAYQGIVSRYQREGWGIFDDTPNPHLALAAADVYYGDWSSMATLVQCTGKPVLQQSWKIDNKIPDGNQSKGQSQASPARQTNIFSFWVSGETAYLYGADTDTLFSLNLDNGDTKIEADLPHGARFGATWKGYLHIEKHENILLFAPAGAPCVACYDLDTKQLHTYDTSSAQTNIPVETRCCCIYGETAYFVPLRGINWMPKLDLKGKKLSWCKDWQDEIPIEKENVDNGVMPHCWGVPLCVGPRLFIPYRCPTGVIEFDCERERTVAFHTLDGCVTIAFDGNTYWWANDGGILSKWDPNTGESTVVHDLSKRLSAEPSAPLVYMLAYSKGFLLLLPSKYSPNIENKVFKVDVKTGAVAELLHLSISPSPEIKPHESLRCYCDARACDDGYIYTYSSTRNTLVRINVENDEVLEIPVALSLYDVCTRYKSYLTETPQFTLENFVDAIAKDNRKDNERTKETTLSVNRALEQIVRRFAKFGEPDVGIHGQDGICGRRVADLVLREAGLEDG